MKQFIEKVIITLSLIGILVYLLGTAIIDMTNKKDLYTVDIDIATEVIESEQSLNNKFFKKLTLLKKTDYYYIGIDKDSYETYIIKAPKNWHEEHFNSDQVAFNEYGLRITALAKPLSDYKVQQELSSLLSQSEELKFPIGTMAYLDLGYKKIIITKFIIFAVILFILISLLLILKYPERITIPLPIISAVLIISCIGCGITLLYLIM